MLQRKTLPLLHLRQLVQIAPCNIFAISPSHHFTISPSHHFTITPFHHLTISPFHHFPSAEPFPLHPEASGTDAGSPPGEASVKARWRSEVRYKHRNLNKKQKVVPNGSPGLGSKPMVGRSSSVAEGCRGKAKRIADGRWPFSPFPSEPKVNKRTKPRSCDRRK